MATEIKIPVPDQTTEEVRIVAWKKAVGETVNKDEVILEVETDKSVIEVEAVETGCLIKQLFEVDDMVPVGDIVGYLGQQGEEAPGGTAPAPAPAQAAPTQAPAAAAPETPAADSSHTEVKIPVPDQTTEEVRIVAWKKNAGEAVTQGETLLEVETDKSVIEVEAVADGTLLQCLFGVDDMVPVGDVVGYIGQAGSAVPTAAPAPSAAQPATPSAPTIEDAAPAANVKATPVAKKVAAKLGVDLNQVKGCGCNGKICRSDVERYQATGTTCEANTTGRLFASPNAKRLARELNIDIAQVPGTGPNGRILGKDVQSFAATAPKPAPVPAMSTPAAASPTTGMSAANLIAQGPANGQPASGTSIQLTKMRNAIGMNLQMSSRDVPHFNVMMSIEMTRALALRQELNQGQPKDQKVSVNDLVVRAASIALRRFPAINSRLVDTTVNYLPDVNIGIATAIETGLVVPVLTNADKRSWRDLAIEAKRIAGEARTGKIIAAGKGTFTISNLGMFGVDSFTAIINPPESAILAVGAVKNQVVDIGGGIGLRPMMNVVLCSDHRIIDGALAAQFLQCMKVYLEEQIIAMD